jgi:hypothetical protein
MKADRSCDFLGVLLMIITISGVFDSSIYRKKEGSVCRFL